jgi:signal transduction histidine kinase/ligand-binding sensor domain-containing protein
VWKDSYLRWRFAKKLCRASFSLIVLSATILCSHSCWGDEYRTRASQYRHHAWRIDEGWLESAPLAIAQTSDGYLWVGTHTGLMRFDGIRFTAWLPPDHSPLAHVKLLLAGEDGDLWVSSATGLSRLHAGTLTDVPMDRGPTTSIQMLYKDRNGQIWIGRAHLAPGDGALCIVSIEVPRCFGSADGYDAGYAASMTQDPDGSFWIGANDLLHWRPGTPAEHYFSKELKSYGNNVGVEALLTEPDGSILAGLTVVGEQAGLQRYRSGHWQRVMADGYDGKEGGYTLLHAADGSLWLTADSDGLVHIQNGRADRYATTDGLTGANVIQFLQDAEGTIWTITEKGIDSFTKLPILSYSYREQVGPYNRAPIAAGRDSNLFIVSDTIKSLTRGEVTNVPISPPFPDGLIAQATLVDSSGRLWFGHANHLYRYDKGKLFAIKAPDGSDALPSRDLVYALAEDQDHTHFALIAGKDRTHLVTFNDSSMTEYQNIEDSARSLQMVVAENGEIWLGGSSNVVIHGKNGAFIQETVPDTGPRFFVSHLDVNGNVVLVSSVAGLRLRTGGHWQTIGKRNGLGCDNIYSTLMDNEGNVWLAGICGLMELTQANISVLQKDPTAIVKVPQWGSSDGWHTAVETFSSSTARTSDGRLWFRADTLETLNPATMIIPPKPPSVYVEEVYVDRKLFTGRALSSVPPNPRNVQFDFTATHVLEARDVQFRYRLLGHESEWQEAGTRRQAFYTDLAPGHYSFEVAARAGASAWSPKIDHINVDIERAYYQTYWFRTLLGSLFFALLWLLYVARLRQVTRLLRLRHEERMGERESIARNLHDTFFQSVQSLFLQIHTTAKRLPVNDDVRNSLERALKDSDGVMLRGRELMLDLRSHAQGARQLADELALIGDAMKPSFAGDFQVAIIGKPKSLRPLVFDEVLQIGQEALNNALLHSKSTAIEVEISYGRRFFKITISDNGVGIGPDVLRYGFRAGHFGMPGMRERAAKIGGQLEIWSGPDNGTEIELRLRGGAAYARPVRRPMIRFQRPAKYEA